MLKELKFLGYFIIIFISTFFIAKTYLSEENIRRTNIAIIQYENKLDKQSNNLPIIKNDTNNIIEYKTDVKEFLDEKPKKWYELIK